MIKKLAFFLLCSASLVASAPAQQIFGVSRISSPQGDFGGAFSLVNAINQSGLSASYTSGVTNFASFVATTTHSSPGSGTNSGFTNATTLPQIFSLDLGSVTSVDGLAIWANANVGSLTAFNLYADSDDSFGNGVGALLGAFNVSGPAGVSAADVRGFSQVATRYLHIEATQPSNLTVGIGEVAFRTSTVVPEPSTYALLASGLLAIGMAARRRRRA